jgi:hypothetical protein
MSANYLATRDEGLETSLLHPDQGAMSLWDHVRWWLLYPRRIEFILWLSGTVLLIGVTIGLVLVTTLSLGMQNAHQSSRVPTAASVKNVTTRTCSAAAPGCTSPTPSTASPKLELLNDNDLVAGSTVQIQGQGFTAHGRINFTYDTQQRCRPDWIQTDAHGTFRLTLMPSDASGWEPGPHTITAYDVSSKHDAVVTMAFVVPTPGVTATVFAPSTVSTAVATPNVVGASPTPVTANPTAIPTPTPTPTRAKSTPAPAPQPTAKPTARPTPTATPTPNIEVNPTEVATPTPNPSPSVSLTGNIGALLAYSAFPELPVNRNNLRFITAAMWLSSIGILLALLFLASAALLRRRHNNDKAR